MCISLCHNRISQYLWVQGIQWWCYILKLYEILNLIDANEDHLITASPTSEYRSIPLIPSTLLFHENSSQQMLLPWGGLSCCCHRKADIGEIGPLLAMDMNRIGSFPWSVVSPAAIWPVTVTLGSLRAQEGSLPSKRGGHINFHYRLEQNCPKQGPAKDSYL